MSHFYPKIRLTTSSFILVLICIILSSTEAQFFLTSTHAAPIQQTSFDCTTVSEIPQTECETLTIFYNSTNGSGWMDNSGWLNTVTPCSWYGVTCTNRSVTKIILKGTDIDNRFGLHGMIPSELGNLLKLEILKLEYNELIGNIPPELGNLTSLTILSLGDNQLSGDIPLALGNLSNLTHLYLHNNQLDGYIPSELGNLTSLTDFWLSSNQLSGHIPLGLANLSNLDRLSLHSNQLSGTIPPWFSNFSRLTRLYLYENQLSGTIPKELGDISSLTRLDIQDNQLDGYIPSKLGNLSNLTILSLGDNQLSGDIPPALGNLSNLTHLYLHNNQLNGSIPPALGNLFNLTHLYLHNNQLDGYIPSELGNLASLTDFWLSSNQLSGHIPLGLANLSNLDRLSLHSNQLSGTIPPWFSNFSKLTRLYLYENQLSGTIPKELGDISSLMRLDIQDNQLDGYIPSELGNLSNLTILKLHKNQLIGVIPIEFGNLSNLTHLFLNENQLSGEIPSTLVRLSNLVSLNLGDNCLTSTNSTILNFLTEKDPDWNEVQCTETPTPTLTNTPSPPTPTPTRTPIPPTLNPTYTPALPTPTATSSAIDAYEPDDFCNQANAIPITGTSQTHNFHSSTDVDWVRFNAKADTYYRIEVQVPTGSSVDAKVEIYGSCDGVSEAEWDENISLSVVTEFQTTEAGPYHLKLLNGSTRFGIHQNYRLTIRELEAENDVGALIIVAGRYRNSDHLQGKIHDVSDDIYAAFESNGYQRNDIQYLATDSNRPGYDDLATKENLRKAITEWAVSKVSDDRPLNIYLVDHGDRETFFIDEVNNQRLSPIELHDWLNQIEAAVPGLEVNVMIEMCHAGSFIATPQSISKEGRVIITSTNVENDAYVAPERGARFSNYFIRSLRGGSSLGNSFYIAQSTVSEISDLQRPWIDSDGDGRHNEVEDYELAEQRSFLLGTLANDEWPPYFMTTQSEVSGNSSNGTIQATVHDDKTITQVWAEIFPPSYAPSSSGVELVMHDVERVTLNHQGNNLYSMSYVGFVESGTYRVILYAEDSDGLVSQPIAVEVEGNGTGANHQLFLPFVGR